MQLKIRWSPDRFETALVSKKINQNVEPPTIDINALFDGIMKSINQFADEIAEQRLQETGRGPENGGKNAENFAAKEKRGMTDFPKRE